MKMLIRVLKAVADPNRMRILKMLQHREMCVCEITEALKITQPSVSRHMRILEEAELVLGRREGQWINYRLNPEPSNDYAASMLDKIKGWLEDDPGIRELIRRASGLNREDLCRAKASRRTSHKQREIRP